MKTCSVARALAVSLLALTPVGAHAQSAPAKALPAVKASGTNKVPECATPGRLMAYLVERNPKLDPRYSGVATAYMRHGEELGMRWDYAFFQMILETGSLGFKNGGKQGSVKPEQYNFAGLGATGGREPGESFSSLDNGVKAHLQHLLMYAGERIQNPVAERTRKVQDWGVLNNWQKAFNRPITFADLAAQWAPGSKNYGSDIHSVGSRFYEGACEKADPKPELVQEARKSRSDVTKVARNERSKGDEIARGALERAREEGDATRSALGAKAIAAGGAGVKVLNETSSDVPAAVSDDASARAQTAPAAAAAGAKAPNSKGGVTPAGAIVVTAAVTAKSPPASAPPEATPPTAKCRVWTASYGGQKAVIIRSSAEQFTNFTVLDVNEGQEAREVEAYIAAYAKGGQKIADFSNQNSALDKAFQMCPEG